MKHQEGFERDGWKDIVESMEAAARRVDQVKSWGGKHARLKQVLMRYFWSNELQVNKTTTSGNFRTVCSMISSEAWRLFVVEEREVSKKKKKWENFVSDNQLDFGEYISSPVLVPFSLLAPENKPLHFCLRYTWKVYCSPLLVQARWSLACHWEEMLKSKRIRVLKYFYFWTWFSVWACCMFGWLSCWLNTLSLPLDSTVTL